MKNAIAVKRALGAALVAACTALPVVVTASPAAAQPAVPAVQSPAFSPVGEVASSRPAYYTYSGYTLSQHQRQGKKLAAKGYRPISLSLAGSRISAVWVKTAGPAWSSRAGLSHAAFDREVRKMRSKGYAPTIITSSGGSFAGVFEKKNAGWQIQWGMTSSQFKKVDKREGNKGRVLVSMTAYGSASAPRYAGVWQQGSSGHGWATGYTASQLNKLIKKNDKKGYYPRQVVVAPDGTYGAVFHPSTGRWWAYYGLTSSQLDRKHKTYGKQGYYPVSVDGKHVQGYGTVYAAVWVKN
ncbi:hypothetical protein ACFOWE_08490 [Planomonospora corallina]|uniref:LGFP repeat-containing protein n=1 Tax=Planomonospora corallina TaxID=1806052 RepID=A0ABV8I5Y1_9ACTN